ncbi:MAG: 50S ribosomal protein L4 [Deltaproteobacteria bacterium]|nr:50S ribosomal protein L4 [Deltaproteobacteria bacterium]MBI3293523.1 50S ribosomal protein L4 [Deltaproteobacteria bacterium]
MLSVPVYDLKKQKVGSMELSDAIFGVVPKPHLLNEAVRAQIAWRYSHKTATCRTRTEVTGTRKKMYKQKGTGRARHGDAKAPIFVGGGKAHGPVPRIVNHKINKKVMRGALLTALTLSHQNDRFFVIETMSSKKPSTKMVVDCGQAFKTKRALFINCAETDEERAFNRGIANVTGYKTIRPEGVNVFDILKFQNLFISRKAAEKLTERLTHAS